MNVVGSHIRKLRKQQRLSQEALASKLNVTRQAVSQWERDNTQPDIGMLTQIAKVLGADIHEVIYGIKWISTPRWSSWVMWPQWYIKYYIYWFFAVPMFYMNISMGALNGCSLLWDIRIRSRIIRYIISGHLTCYECGQRSQGVRKMNSFVYWYRVTSFVKRIIINLYLTVYQSHRQPPDL